jgi:cytochrome c6
MTKQFLFFFISFHFFSSSLLSGEILFQANCSSCHLNGTNLILPEKNLKKEILESNGLNTIEGLIYQLRNGKNGMPSFGGRLSEEELTQIAYYVLDQF